MLRTAQHFADQTSACPKGVATHFHLRYAGMCVNMTVLGSSKISEINLIFLQGEGQRDL